MGKALVIEGLIVNNPLCVVTFDSEVESIEINVPSVTLNNGGTSTITATVTTTGAAISPTFTSSNTSVATVTSSGNTATITAVGSGNCNIVIKAGSKTVTCPVTVNVSSAAQAAIEASGNTSMTNAQKSAVDKLFVALGADGSNDVWGKMHKVYLPIIAGDISKALVNYKTNTADKVLTSTDWTFRSHGLVGTSTADNYIQLSDNNPIQVNDFCCISLRTELMEDGVDDSTYIVGLRGTTNRKYVGMLNTSSTTSRGSNTGVHFGSYGANWGNALGTYSKTNDAIKSCAINSGDTTCDYIMAGNYGQVSAVTPTNDMSGETSQTLYLLGVTNKNTSKPYAVVIYGEHIETSQLTNIASSVDALYEAFSE